MHRSSNFKCREIDFIFIKESVIEMYLLYLKRYSILPQGRWIKSEKKCIPVFVKKNVNWLILYAHYKI